MITKRWTFRDIVTLNSIEALLEHRKEHVGMAYMLLCQSGHMEMEYRGEKKHMRKFDLLMSAADQIPQNRIESDDFRCTIYALEAKSLDDILFACIKEEPSWMQKLRYVLLHPILHLSRRQVRLLGAYEGLIQFYSDGTLWQADSSYRLKRRVAFLQGQAMVLEFMSWIDQAMTRDKQQADTARENSSQEMNNRTNELYTRFITMLYTYGLAERRVSWYANQMHITPAYLHHICSQAAGQSPQEIIGNMILREAKQRLSSPEASIKETAFALNFGSESSFCKFFKKLEGKTPSEYRSLN